jgi:hypothetical protein
MTTITPEASLQVSTPPLTPSYGRPRSKASIGREQTANYRPNNRNPGRISDLDSLLKIAEKPLENARVTGASASLQAQAHGLAGPSAATTLAFDVEPRPAIFLGLRNALMFNAGVGICAMLAYEFWAFLAH